MRHETLSIQVKSVNPEIETERLGGEWVDL